MKIRNKIHETKRIEDNAEMVFNEVKKSVKFNCEIEVPFWTTKREEKKFVSYMKKYVKETLNQELSFIPMDQTDMSCSGQTKIKIK